MSIANLTEDDVAGKCPSTAPRHSCDPQLRSRDHRKELEICSLSALGSASGLGNASGAGLAKQAGTRPQRDSGLQVS